MPLHLKTECLNLKCSMVLIRAVTKSLGLGTFLGYYEHETPATFIENKRKIERDPWIVFRNDVVPPSWMLILPESWDESKSVFKGEVDGFKIGDWEGRGGKNTPLSSPLPPPLPLSLFRCFSRWRPQSMYLRVFVKKSLLCRLEPRVLPCCAITTASSLCLLEIETVSHWGCS